jgi:hypothetical protein
LWGLGTDPETNLPHAPTNIVVLTTVFRFIFGTDPHRDSRERVIARARAGAPDLAFSWDYSPPSVSPSSSDSSRSVSPGVLRIGQEVAYWRVDRYRPIYLHTVALYESLDSRYHLTFTFCDVWAASDHHDPDVRASEVDSLVGQGLLRTDVASMLACWRGSSVVGSPPVLSSARAAPPVSSAADVDVAPLPYAADIQEWDTRDVLSPLCLDFLDGTSAHDLGSPVFDFDLDFSDWPSPLRSARHLSASASVGISPCAVAFHASTARSGGVAQQLFNSPSDGILELASASSSTSEPSPLRLRGALSSPSSSTPSTPLPAGCVSPASVLSVYSDSDSQSDASDHVSSSALLTPLLYQLATFG